MTRRSVALNGIRRGSTCTTRTSDQPVTGVTGGCDLIGAIGAGDRGRVGTVASRGAWRTSSTSVSCPGIGIAARWALFATSVAMCRIMLLGTNWTSFLIGVQPVTRVTGGRNLIGAIGTRDRGRVGTFARRSTSTTRGAGGASTGVGVRP